MATTQKEHNGNGTQRRFDFDFPYIKEDDVKVSLRTNTADLTDIPSTEYTFPSATEIQFNALSGAATTFQETTGAPKNGVIVRVFRDTDLNTERVTFFPGSSIRAQDLNENTLQLLYSNQERQNRAIDSIGGTMIGNLVLNGADIVFEGTSEDDFETVLKVTNPTADQTYRLPNLAAGTYDVITSGDTGTVVTGLIANDAINGDKIADDVIDSEHYVAGSIDTEHLAAGISGSKLADDSVDLDKLSNADVVETTDYSTAWATDDTKIATVGALEARHDVVVNTDVNPPSTDQTGKQWLSIAPGNQVHKIYDGSGWRTVAVGQPYSPRTTTVVRYVDVTNGSDASDVTGFLPQAPLQSIKRALELVNASATGDGTLIKVSPGVYQETLPLVIQKNNVSIVGESMRSCFVHPTVSTQGNNMFEVDSGSYIANLTLLGLIPGGNPTRDPATNEITGSNALFSEDDDNDRLHGLPGGQNFAVVFRNGCVILKSPYIQNCTHFSDAQFENDGFDPNTFEATDDPNKSAIAGDTSSQPSAGGLLVDGNAVDDSSPVRSMVVDAFTQITLDGPGVLVTNNGYAQLVSFFGTFCHYHAKAKNGGQINLSNCVSDFGRFGLIADGKSPTAIATATANAANAGATTITVGAISTAASFHGTVTQPLDHMMVTIDGVDYGVVSSTANNAGWDIVLATGLTSNITNTNVSFALRSYISTGGHTFEFVGVGTDYSVHPDNGGVPVEANQVVELRGGKVWQSSTDHVGKFKAGDVLVVDQVSETVALKDTTITGDLAVTGTVDGRDVAADGNTLDALNTNAVLDTDTTTANMQFVVDEDNMASDSDTKVPTQQSVKAYVDTEIAGLVDTAPATLDTLNELAAALGDDANFSTTVTNSIATKLNASAVSAYGATLVDDADAATARTTLGLGTAAVAATSDFATAAQGTLADNALPASDVSTFGGTLIDDADAAAARTTLGLGTAATSATSDFATAAQGTTADNALPTAGGTMAGDIAMGSNKITGLGAPSAAGDATTKQYVDAQISASGSGTVTNVSGTSPISVTNGTSTPTISISAATTSAAGTMSSTDKIKLDGLQQSDWNASSGGAVILNKPTIPSGDIVDDTTPQLGGNLDVQSNEINTSTSNGNIKLNPNGSGVVEIKGDGSSNDGTLQLNCSQNSHGVKIKSPPHSAAASYTLTLPDTDGNANEVLQTDGSGGLSWVAQSGGGGGITIQEEGVDLTTDATTLNFVGTSVTASGTGTTKTITISGGGGGAADINGLSDGYIDSTFNNFGLGATSYGATGVNNLIIGLNTGTGTIVNKNTLIGIGVGNSLTSAYSSVGIGANAFGSVSAVSYDIAIGDSAMENSAASTYDGYHNVAIGAFTLRALGGSALGNVAIGMRAGEANQSGRYNVHIGYNAGNDADTARYNTCIGGYAGQSITAGDYNSTLGYEAGDSITIGYSNVIIGSQAGGVQTGNNNIVIGSNATASSTSVSNEITIGTTSTTRLRLPGLMVGASNGDVLTYNSTTGLIELSAPSGGGVTYELIEKGLSKAAGSYIDISGYKAVYMVCHNDPATNGANRNGPYLSTSNTSNTGVSTGSGRFWRRHNTQGYQASNYSPTTNSLYYGSNTTGDNDKVWKLHLMGLDQTNVFIEAYSENNGQTVYEETGWSGVTNSGSSTWYLYIHQALLIYQIYGVK